MKLSALTVTSILAAFTPATVHSVPAHKYFARMRFSRPGGWQPSESLFKNVMVKPNFPNDLRYNSWSAEEWAAEVLLTCRSTRGCKSCISFLAIPKDDSKVAVWNGYLFDTGTEERDFYLPGRSSRDPYTYDYSIGYYVGWGVDPDPRAAKDEVQDVLDL